MTSSAARVAVGRHWPNAVLSILILLFLGLTFRSGAERGMRSGEVDPSWRYRLYGVPIVVSQIYYGRPYDYVGYKLVELYAAAPTASIDGLAVSLKSIANVGTAGLFFILNDDKGIVDFTRLAVLFYGLSVASLYDMYFTLFALSCLLFIVSHFTTRHKLALLALLVLAVYANMPGFIARRPAISILDMHTFGILSMPAALHVLLLATDRNPARLMHVVTTTAQALIFTLICHARFSSVSQAAVIVVAYPLILWAWARPRPAGWWSGELTSGHRLEGAWPLKRAAPLLLLVTALALLPVYQRYAYNPGYFGRGVLLRHPVYHNLLIGMQWNPHLRDRYGLGTGDLGAAAAVDAFLERNRLGPVPGRSQWAVLGLNSGTTQEPFDWVEYEEAARDLYTLIWRQDPVQSLLTYIYHHPVDIYAIARSYLTGSPAPPFDLEMHLVTNDVDTRDVYRPITLTYVLLALATGALCWPERKMLPITHLLGSIALLASALLVPIAFYGGGFVILAETFVVATFAVYAGAAGLTCWLVDSVVTSSRRAAPVGGVA